MPKKSRVETQVPKWMECSWRRVPCGKKSCPLCSRFSAEHERHLEATEEPDELELVFDDVANGFKETLEFIKQDAKSRGINIASLEGVKTPPRPQEFPFYSKLSAWHHQVSALITAAEIGGDLWLATEAAADLMWYKNILLSKVYRQLCTRWERKQGVKYGDVDLKYTSQVLKEVIGLLLKSLRELSLLESAQKGGLFLSLVRLQQLEKTIRSL